MDFAGHGSWSGTDFPGVQAMVLEQYPSLSHLVELPDRGTPAGMIGRTAAMLSGLNLDLQPNGWRITDRSGVDHRRARATLRDDLDQLEELAQGFQGRLTVSAAGPWTMAARVERPRGDKVLADHGLRRELGQSLAAGLADLISELGRRLPEAGLIMKLDEPMLPAVAQGAVPTASGFSRLRSVDIPELSERLGEIVEAVNCASVVHCCAAGLPLGAVLSTGAGVAVNAALLTNRGRDQLGVAVESGQTVWLGVIPTGVQHEVNPDAVAEDALQVLRRFGLDPARTTKVVLTPDCGFAGWTTTAARQASRALARATEQVAERLSTDS